MLDSERLTDRPPRRTALIAQELSRYQIDIAALSETRLADEGCITEEGGGYTFFWKGYAANERRIHGVGFAIRSRLVELLEDTPTGVSARLIRMRLPITCNRYVTVLSCYAPTLDSSEEEKDAFYDCLDEELQRIPAADKIVLLGDFNARVGT
jgi:exonuclease III